MPNETELPAGSVRDFVQVLFTLYRAAHRPTLEAMSKHIRDGGYTATASKETLRKMLRGTTISAQLADQVARIILALCELAGREPDDRITLELADGTIMDASPMYLAETLWHEALDAPDLGAPTTAIETASSRDANAERFGVGVTRLTVEEGNASPLPGRLGTHVGEYRYNTVDRLPSGRLIARPLEHE